MTAPATLLPTAAQQCCTSSALASAWTKERRKAQRAVARAAIQVHEPCSSSGLQLCSRRGVVLAGSVSLLTAWRTGAPDAAQAVQGLTAGRIPGLTAEPDEQGFYTYARPEGKSGGHGVGWSEIPRYRFKVPSTWEERPVSIADLGGTEIDLRFSSKDQGELAVVVAPVLRFADIGFNASVTIEELGTPEKIICGFAPELFGKPLEDDDIVETRVTSKKGSSTTYYEWMVKPHRLVSATAYGNRIFIMSVMANARQWRKYEPQLRAIVSSFLVPCA